MCRWRIYSSDVLAVSVFFLPSALKQLIPSHSQQLYPRWVTFSLDRYKVWLFSSICLVFLPRKCHWIELKQLLFLDGNLVVGKQRNIKENRKSLDMPLDTAKKGWPNCYFSLLYHTGQEIPKILYLQTLQQKISQLYFFFLQKPSLILLLALSSRRSLLCISEQREQFVFTSIPHN